MVAVNAPVTQRGVPPGPADHTGGSNRALGAGPRRTPGARGKGVRIWGYALDISFDVGSRASAREPGCDPGHLSAAEGIHPGDLDKHRFASSAS